MGGGKFGIVIKILEKKFKGSRRHLKNSVLGGWKIWRSVKNSGKKIQGLPRALSKIQFERWKIGQRDRDREIEIDR